MSNPIQVAEHVLAEWPCATPADQSLPDRLASNRRRVTLRNLWTHARTLEGELARKSTVSDAQWEIVESYKKENAELRAALEGMISEFVGPYEEGWSSVQRAYRVLAASHAE